MAQPKIPKIPMPGNFVGQLPNGIMQVGMNPEAFQKLIEGKGIKMVHARPLPCPNILDLHNGDHDPACNKCYNGMIYYGQKEFIGAFMGDSNNRQFMMNGQWDMEQVTIVLPTKYLDGTELDAQLFDQISVQKTMPVRYYQRVEHSQIGLDKLHFPAISVDHLMDASGKQYTPGVDFVVEDGHIRWTSQNRPDYNLSIGRGTIYSVNYYTIPVFTIIGLPHQFRTTQALDAQGKPYIERYPQMAACRKDFIPYDSTDKVAAPDAPEPRDGQIK